MSEAAHLLEGDLLKAVSRQLLDLERPPTYLSRHGAA